MPTKGSPRHAFRFEPGLWSSFLAAVAHDPHGRKVAEVVRDFVAWYARERGAPKPERPAAGVVTTPPEAEAAGSAGARA